MRQPYPLAPRRKSEGEFLVCLLANLTYVFGTDEPDVDAVEDKLLDLDAPYRTAGELTVPWFLLRELNFHVQAVGETNLVDRLRNWRGPGGLDWLGKQLAETPRRPTLGDIDAFVDAGWAVIATVRERYGTDIVVPASTVLIVGPGNPWLYSAAGDGEPHLYRSTPFLPHWDFNQGILAVRPA